MHNFRSFFGIVLVVGESIAWGMAVVMERSSGHLVARFRSLRLLIRDSRFDPSSAIHCDRTFILGNGTTIKFTMKARS